MTKRVALLTSGGDCAGLNAVMRAVVIRAHALGWEVVGLQNGMLGLLEDPIEHRMLTPADFSHGVMRAGGTILGTASSRNPLKYKMPDGSVQNRAGELVDGLKSLNVDAVIGIGGDGSFDIMNHLVEEYGVNFVGIPKTIDNDVNGTELAVGFDSAVAIVTDTLDKLQSTAQSHNRVMILEVMGRDAGHLALSSGIAGGADIILIPEISCTLESLITKIESIYATGRRYALIVVSEAVKTPEGDAHRIQYAEGQERYGGIADYIRHQLTQHAGVEARSTVLGHVQRGGEPTCRDRILASSFGVKAVDLVAAEQFGRIVVWCDGKVDDIAMKDAVKKTYRVDVDGDLVHVARALGISFGD